MYNSLTKLFPHSWLAIFGLIAFHVFGNVLWISLNNTPPTWDAALHTILSIKFLDYFQSNITSFNIVDFLKISEYYPPLVHWIGTAIAAASDSQYKSIALSGTFFLSLGIIFQYLYVNELFQNKRLSLLATFFFSFFLTIYQQSRDHMLDIPLASLILATLYFLAKSEHFDKRIYSFLFFILLALASLTKWYAALYFAIPVINEVAQIIKYKKIEIPLLKTLILGLIMFAVLVSPWYLTNFQKFWEISRGSLTPEAANPQNIVSLENWLFNLKLIINFQIFFAGFIFFLVSLFFFVKKFRLRPIWLTLSILGLNYVFFTIILTKNIRYTIPMMPFVAIIMAYGANYFWQNVKTRIGVIIILVFYLFSYLCLSFGFPIRSEFKYSLDLPLLGWTDILYLSDHPVKAIFDSKTWPNKQILVDILTDSLDKQRIMLLNLSDRGYLNGYNLDPNLYSDLPKESRKIQLYFLPLLDNYNTTPPEVDYVLVPKKHVALPEGSKQFDNLTRFQQIFLKGQENNFRLIKIYSIKGDYFHPELFPEDQLLLYKKTDLSKRGPLN